MNIYESSEDYLEAILMLQEKNGNVHSIDIAQELDFSKASVSIAMKKLRENGYISMDHSGLITLLPPGKEIAERIFDRHQTLNKFFESIGVDSDTAQKDACKVEHDISEITFDKIKELVNQK